MVLTRFPWTFSENRLNRFRESDILRHIFERVVIAAIVTGLVKGEGFGQDSDELNWIEQRRQKGRWWSICRHSKPKRRLKALPKMTVMAVAPSANDGAVMSVGRPRRSYPQTCNRHERRRPRSACSSDMG